MLNFPRYIIILAFTPHSMNKDNKTTFYKKNQGNLSKKKLRKIRKTQKQQENNQVRKKETRRGSPVDDRPSHCSLNHFAQ